jgi:DNA replicative helicase MCM subunit Mcm2 (Cdc46/Mcm family)
MASPIGSCLLASRRTASIPEPPVIDWTEGEAAGIVDRLQETLKVYCPHPIISSANPDLDFRFSREAKEKWAQIYHEISKQSANKHGYAGAIIARAKPTILRLSMIYSALDRTSLIEPKHLDAASALWNYATDSATWAFSGMSGSKEANEILKCLKRNSDGVDRTMIFGEVFKNHISGHKLTETLSELKSSGLAKVQKKLWFPV